MVSCCLSTQAVKQVNQMNKIDQMSIQAVKLVSRMDQIDQMESNELHSTKPSQWCPLA